MKNKQPPFQITNKIIDEVAEISELTGRLSAHDHLSSNPICAAPIGSEPFTAPLPSSRTP